MATSTTPASAPPAACVPNAGPVRYALFDRYTVGHAAAGLLLSLNGVGALPTLALAIVWEGFADKLPPGYMVFPKARHKLRLHQAVDVLAVMAGFYAVRILPKPKTAPAGAIPPVDPI